MEHKSDKERLNLAYGLFKDMQQDNLEYTYRGEFSTSITDNILALAEANIDDTKDKRKLKKRVYFIMVEGLQNITRHQENTGDAPFTPGLFVIQRKKDAYFITTGNLIKNENIENLKKQLDTINALSSDELKSYYLDILNSGSMSVKGGAGLGLIEIARKSGSKLLYDFSPVDENYSYFYLHCEISFNKDKSKTDVSGVSLAGIKQLHKILDEFNILLNFAGIFNQDNLVNLLSIIEQQMQGTVLIKLRIFNIMVEMLQNILKHADDYVFDNVAGHYGIFFISETDDLFYLISGNYINSCKVNPLKAKIDRLNSLSLNDLNLLYGETLMDMEIDNNESSGLGLIDMRLKSRNAIEYNFIKVDDNFSFFSLLVKIDKNHKILETLKIDATKDAPGVNFDAETGKLLIHGISMPENALDFYKPIIDWLKEYSSGPLPNTEFVFDLSYGNTASLKQLIKIANILGEIALGSLLRVKWYFNKNDLIWFETGKRISKLTGIDMEFIEH